MSAKFDKENETLFCQFKNNVLQYVLPLVLLIHTLACFIYYAACEGGEDLPTRLMGLDDLPPIQDRMYRRWCRLPPREQHLQTMGCLLLLDYQNDHLLQQR